MMVYNGSQSTGGSSSGSAITTVLTALPNLDASKAGEEFYFNGTLWTYAQENQFGDLPVGTPYPAKGFKEILIRFLKAGAVLTLSNIGEYPNASLTSPSTGVYHLDLGTSEDINNSVIYGNMINRKYSITAGRDASENKFIIHQTNVNTDALTDMNVVEIAIRMYPK